MLAIEILVFFYLTVTMVHASRKDRVADGTLVNSTHTYPWMVSIVSVYRSGRGTGRSIDAEEFCTGFLLDIYGSVLTAGHCVREWKEYKENGRFVVNLRLQFTNVTIGTLEPYPSALHTEKVNPGPRIRRYQTREPKVYPPNTSLSDIEPLEVDIALIYLTRFETSGIDCNQHPNIRPIDLATTQEGVQVDRPTTGIFAGFGAQPIEDAHGFYGFLPRGNLAEIGIEYHGHLDVAKCTPLEDRMADVLTSEFLAYGVPGRNHQGNNRRNPRFRGTCDGDSGGPYMVEELGSMRARAMLYAGRCDEVNNNNRQKCVEVNETSYFVDLNNQFVRKWVLDELERRYTGLGKDTSSVPKSC